MKEQEHINCVDTTEVVLMFPETTFSLEPLTIDGEVHYLRHGEVTVK